MWNGKHCQMEETEKLPQELDCVITVLGICGADEFQNEQDFLMLWRSEGSWTCVNSDRKHYCATASK